MHQKKETGMRELDKDIEKFRADVSKARADFDAYLGSGRWDQDRVKNPDSLDSRLEELRQREMKLLTEALPYVRASVLDSRDPGAAVTGIVRKAGALAEADLPADVKELCKNLLSLDPPDEPEIPEEGDREDEPKIPEESDREDEPEIPEEGDWEDEPDSAVEDSGSSSGRASLGYEGSPYLSVGNENTYFLFLDDGSVILFENNEGWRHRKEPILHDCFAQNAIPESDHSCLILNLDGGIDRISYRRLETADDLYELPVYTT